MKARIAATLLATAALPGSPSRGQAYAPLHVARGDDVIETWDTAAPADPRAVEITAPSFSSPAEACLPVMMEGLDRAGHDVGNRRSVTYDELTPGRYALRVRAANEGGRWNEQGASLALDRTPLVWQTGWFRLCAAAALVTIGALGSWRLAHARSAHRRDEQEARRKDQELALQRSELAHLSRAAMLGELSGALAHELNQPLTAILSNAQAAERLMARDRVDAGEIREILADIVEQDKRAGEIIRRLRALLTKGEAQHQELDLGEVVRDVIRLMHSELVRHDVDVECGPIAPLLVCGDRVQLQQVLLNLLVNALDAMNPLPAGQRRLVVRAGADDGHAWVSVRDAGPGLAPEVVDRLFDPFFTTKSGGMGLGLTVCRSIMESHGGRIRAENDLAGGAAFVICIPSSAGNGHHEGDAAADRVPGR